MESGLLEREKRAIKKLFITVSLVIPIAITSIIYMTTQGSLDRGIIRRNGGC